MKESSARRASFIVGGAVLVAVAAAVAFFPTYTSRTSPPNDTVLASTEADLTLGAAPSEIERIFNSIQALPLPSAERKRLLASWLETQSTPEQTPYAYWEAPAVREARNRLLKHAVAQSTRRELQKLLGTGAIDDPELAFLFQPYRDRYRFLSPAKQLEVEDAALNVDRALLASGTTPIEAQAQLRAARQKTTDAVKAALTEDEFAQYQQRESPAALMLANSGFTFTQKEFDALYPLMSQDDASIGLKRFDEHSTALVREVLGEDRFLEYRKVQDPMYRLLTAVSAAHGKQNADVNTAYRAVFANQEKSIELQRAGPVLSRQGLQTKAKLATDLRAALLSSIGPDATDIFLRSMDSSRSLAQVRPN